LHPNAKSNFDDYETLEKIAIHVTADEREHDRLRAHATETYLIDNGDFGHFLVQQFEAMERAGASAKLIMMESTTHAMLVTLRIEYKDGKKGYRVELYDPNLSTTHARSASDDLHAFAFQNVRGYLDADALQKLYYPEPNGISLLHVYPGNDAFKAMASLPPGAAPGRKLTGRIPDEKIDATAIWHLVSDGFAGDLRCLKEEIARRSEDERITLLAAKDDKRPSALFMALQYGHTDAVEAYGELLELIPEEQRAEPLAAKAPDGTPALHRALLDGDAAAIKIHGKLILSLNLTEGERAELLAAENVDGTPGLFEAFEGDHTEALDAYVELLNLLPQEQREKLFARVNADGTRWLFQASEMWDAEIADDYEELLLRLGIPDNQRAELRIPAYEVMSD
jgi:hypothetical protein